MSEKPTEPTLQDQALASVALEAREIGLDPAVVLRRAVDGEKLVQNWGLRTGQNPLSHFTELLKDTLRDVDPLEGPFVLESPSALDAFRWRIAARNGGSPDACDKVAEVIAPRRPRKRGISASDYEARHKEDFLRGQYYVCKGFLTLQAKKIPKEIKAEGQVLSWLRSKTPPAAEGSDRAKFIMSIGAAISRLRSRRPTKLSDEILRCWLETLGRTDSSNTAIERARREIEALEAKRRRARKQGFDGF